MRTCKKCGKTEDQFDSMGSFLAHCRSCKAEINNDGQINENLNKEGFTETPDIDNVSEIIKAALTGIADDLDTEPDTADDTAEQEEVQEIPSLPLSICPNEIGYLADNQLIKIVVIGRKHGDRFVVEGTKYR